MRHAHSAHESALTPACRTASLPSSMLKSSGRLQHQSALRSPFENAVEGSGATPSLPDACALAVTMEPTTEATSRDLELTLCWSLPLAVVISPFHGGDDFVVVRCAGVPHSLAVHMKSLHVGRCYAH